MDSTSKVNVRAIRIARTSRWAVLTVDLSDTVSDTITAIQLYFFLVVRNRGVKKKFTYLMYSSVRVILVLPSQYADYLAVS